jgi:hypothetical protein
MEETLRAAYRFLARFAFAGVKLPERVRLRIRRMDRYDGYYYPHPHTIVIGRHVRSGTALLRVLAHEMCHLALERAGSSGHVEHDREFAKLASLVCRRMGWRKRGF